MKTNDQRTQQARSAIALAIVVVLVPTVVALLVAAVALVIPLVVGFVCTRRWPAQRQLVAYYRGWTVTLFSSPNQLVFNQVTRALQRAIETHRDGKFPSGM